MAAGSVFRGVIRGHIATSEWVNTMYFRQAGATDDLGSLADAIDSTIYDAMITKETAGWKVDDITLTELVIGGGEQLIHVSSTVGTAAGSTGQVTGAMVGSFRTTLAGRSHRGRNYLPLSVQSEVVDGLIGADVVTAYKNALTAFLAIYGVGGTGVGEYEWGVWSRKLGEVFTAGHLTGYNLAAGFFPISAVKVDNVARVIRKREVGVGV